MNTYGIHGIHGRAPAIATGLAMARPDLDVWVITGDGDGLSIGGNHLIHALRRNVNLTILLFNNQIYGSDQGPVLADVASSARSPSRRRSARSTPRSTRCRWPSAPRPRFVARTHDLDRKHMKEMFRAAHDHKGAAFVEICQNCNVFNDGVFDDVLTKEQPRRHADPARARRADPLRRRRRQGRGDGQRRPAAHRDGGRRGRGQAARARRPPRRPGPGLRPGPAVARRPRADAVRRVPPGRAARVRRGVEPPARCVAAEQKGSGDLAALLRSNGTWTVDSPPPTPAASDRRGTPGRSAASARRTSTWAASARPRGRWRRSARR